MSVVAVKRNLNFTWAKETDPKETYEFEFTSDSQWLCSRSSWQGLKKFPVRYDVATRRLCWGSGYFLEASELEANPERCCWYRVSDKDKPKKTPSFVWLRRGNKGGQAKKGAILPHHGSMGGGATQMLTPQNVIKAVAKQQATRAAIVKDAVGTRIKEPTKILARGETLDKEYVAKRAISTATKPASPEVILDLDQIAVIYKPPHWKCELPHRDDKDDNGRGPKILLRWIKEKITSIDEQLFEEEFNPALSGTGFGPLSHRIDQETSGPLLVAKTSRAQRHLKSQFHQTSVSKQYVCLVHGRMSQPEGTIDAKIRTLRTGEMSKSEVSSSGDWALTDYQVIATYKNDRPQRNSEGYDGYSLVACRIKSGRTHQIRVHMLHLGHPLVSDDKYLKSETVAEDREWCPRLFLHCYRLGFSAMDRQPQLVVCPLPEDLKMALVRLGAAQIAPRASDLLFEETSWQREVFRPSPTSWRPGTQVLRRVAKLVENAAGEAVPLEALREDAQLQAAMAEEGNSGTLGRAWLAHHYDIFETVEGGSSSKLAVRLRTTTTTATGTSLETELERQLETVRSEVEDLERQKQRAIAEEDYTKAGDVKRRLEAATAELSSLQNLLADETTAADEDGQSLDASTYAEQRALAAKRQPFQPKPRAIFTEDVTDEAAFPSLVPTTTSATKKRQSQDNTMGGDASEPAEMDEPPIPLEEALVSFLRTRTNKVAYMNEINSDKTLKKVMLSQPQPILSINKIWLQKHEDLFAFLHNQNNESFVALREAAQKKSDPKAKAKPAATANPKAASSATNSSVKKTPAYQQVVQKAGGDPKPMVYEYQAAARTEKDDAEACKSTPATLNWQDQFQKALERSPAKKLSAEELLGAVPLFGPAMGMPKLCEQKELLVMFLSSYPDKFRVDKEGSGSERRYSIAAK